MANVAKDRANHADATIEVCRHCPPDYEAESLPSYTIVSGLPTYDDALEEFRKAGIILTPTVVPIIKIFENVNSESGAKEHAVAYSLVETMPGNDANAENISLNSISCSCGGSTSTATLPSYSVATAAAMAAATDAPQVIELSPDHLASLSQKRLSLQISFNNSLRNRSRSTLRNHLLRSRAVGNTAGLGLNPVDTTVTISGGSPTQSRDSQVLPPIHRSSSTVSLTNEQQLLDQRLRHLHHRGSLY
ncbi:comm3 [Drosophila busckii]|uniref:Comm3 n=1 Tax=Drosophila busckii TaxID=30019 RepID=A0A0M4F0N9_DROBS|nr:comm3 [Drosophila busckii]